jgi:hypothetical protein
VRRTTPRNWAELKRCRFRDWCIGSTFWFAGLGALLVVVAKIVYQIGTTDRLLSPMLFRLGLPQLAVAFIVPLWGIPGIPLLWQLDYLYGYGLCFGLFVIGVWFFQRAKKKSQTMRDVGQRTQEDHLRRELGYPPGGSPQHTNITNVTARTITESAIGISDGANVALSSTHNNLNLPAVMALVNEMLTRIEELHLPTFEHMQLRAQLSAIRREGTSQTPNHPRLHRVLEELRHTLRHLAEAGTAHVLVSHWQAILHTLLRQ